jgi:hypothetical protein
MSKSELSTTTTTGASASQSKSVQKVLDIERRFIDDLMTLRRSTHLQQSVEFNELCWSIFRLMACSGCHKQIELIHYAQCAISGVAKCLQIFQLSGVTQISPQLLGQKVQP